MRRLKAIVVFLALLGSARLSKASESLFIESGSFKADGSFELIVTGPPSSAFYIEVSLDGRMFSGLSQRSAIEGALLVQFYFLGEDGKCTASDPEAGESPFRFYRLHRFEMVQESLAAFENLVPL